MSLLSNKAVLFCNTYNMTRFISSGIKTESKLRLISLKVIFSKVLMQRNVC